MKKYEKYLLSLAFFLVGCGSSVPPFVSTPPQVSCAEIDSMYRAKLALAGDWQDTLDVALLRAHETFLGSYSLGDSIHLPHMGDVVADPMALTVDQWCTGFQYELFSGDCGIYALYLARLLVDLEYAPEDLWTITYADPFLTATPSSHTDLVVRARNGKFYLLSPNFAAKIVDSTGHYKDVFEAIDNLKNGSGNDVFLYIFTDSKSKALSGVHPACNNNCMFGWKSIDTVYPGIKKWILVGDTGGYPGFIMGNDTYYEFLWSYYHGTHLELSDSASAVQNWPYIQFLCFPDFQTPGVDSLAFDLKGAWSSAIQN